ncbi:hypothetical protein B7494_g7815 [Chlorociboria aeruginascens]|nr:hypothetical protein B7494_g7815 [Chlorociboria aeruginascens]
MRLSQTMNYAVSLVILSASTRTAASLSSKRNYSVIHEPRLVPMLVNLFLRYVGRGPGDPGVDFLLESGSSVLIPVVGTNFDIVSFDPRGMGRSIPLANCSSSTNTKLRSRAFGLAGPELPDAYWNQTFETAIALGQECNATIGGPDEAGPHMSTAVVARDMLSIVDAFAATECGKSVETSSLLNYWGFSYGTFIGETFASMYPDRVGRMAIDGVVDPEDYITGQELDDIDFEDAVISTFFTYCYVAGPSLCDFFTGDSAQDIQVRFENIFDQLNATYAVSQSWSNATVLTESLALVKSTIRLTAYTPIASFPILAAQLVAYESALTNLTLERIQAASSLGETTTNVTGTLPELAEWLPAVSCSDAPSIYGDTYQDLKISIAELEQESFLGGEVWASTIIYCTGWPIRATWRYAGPFGGCPKNPLLFVSNTLDPATPIKNSQKWAPQFEGSQLLTINAIGTGHKLQARNLALSCSIPMLPALQWPTSSVPSLSAFAKEVGYPIIIITADGGGGRGIRILAILLPVETRNETMNMISSAASNVLFRKGDAWAMTPTPESDDANRQGIEQPAPNHLQILRVNRYEFPTSSAPNPNLNPIP